MKSDIKIVGDNTCLVKKDTNIFNNSLLYLHINVKVSHVLQKYFVISDAFVPV